MLATTGQGVGFKTFRLIQKGQPVRTFRQILMSQQGSRKVPPKSRLSRQARTPGGTELVALLPFLVPSFPAIPAIVPELLYQPNAFFCPMIRGIITETKSGSLIEYSSFSTLKFPAEAGSANTASTLTSGSL
jgi:hypothetical protein